MLMMSKVLTCEFYWTLSTCDGNMLRSLSLVTRVVEYPACQCQGVCTECIILPSRARSHATERSPVSLLERVSIRIISLDIHGPLKTPKNFSVPLTQWDYSRLTFSTEISGNYELVCPCNLDFHGPQKMRGLSIMWSTLLSDKN